MDIQVVALEELLVTDIHEPTDEELELLSYLLEDDTFAMAFLNPMLEQHTPMLEQHTPVLEMEIDK